MKSNIFHHAFRIDYGGRARALVTECAIALPLAIDPSRTKQFFPFKAIWDTGATSSVIAENVVTKVSLTPTGRTKTRGVHGERQVNTYIVDIGLPNKVCIVNVKVSEGKLMDNIDVLIGMDIIQSGDFCISNSNGKTVFSYCLPPHKNPIDLLEKSLRVNPKSRPALQPVISS
ncbi:MAG: retroviral-like aspartic protease family protein [Candidatus Omnitrophica bacterium]|nr:retroviral-like aspartic protease family protein [Candidatus Omnitrophota bacterium]